MKGYMGSPTIGFRLKLALLYGRYFPDHRGKGRILNAFLRVSNALPHNLSTPPRNLIVSSKDGRKFRVNLNDRIYRGLFLMGHYEKHETEILRKIVKKGDVVFDIGANFGWYTTLLAELVGPKGQVHSFEPVPTIFDELRFNLGLNGLTDNIFLNNFALGMEEGTVTLHLFAGLSTGHASISSLGRDDYITFESRIMPLDRYISDNSVGRVDLVKCDVEGAEMMVIKGGSALFSRRCAPIVLIERNMETYERFGYNPEDLLLQLSEYNQYRFFEVSNGSKLRSLKSLTLHKHTDNIICMPDNRCIGLVQRSSAIQGVPRELAVESSKSDEPARLPCKNHILCVAQES